MPYSIGNPAAANPAVYQLGAEEFTILAASFTLHSITAAPPYGYPTIEYRDAQDRLIYRQTLNTIEKDEIGVSCSTGAEPWYLSNGGQFGFPQATDQQKNAGMSIRLPEITLTPGCTFGVYIAIEVLTDNRRPAQFFLSSNFNVYGLHLWVEDTVASRFRSAPPPTPPGPYMLVPGPTEAGVAA